MLSPISLIVNAIPNSIIVIVPNIITSLLFISINVVVIIYFSVYIYIIRYQARKVNPFFAKIVQKTP